MRPERAKAGHSTTGEVVTPFLLLLPFVVVLLIYGAGSVVAGPSTWGFNIWAVLPRWYALLGLALAILLCLPAFASALGRMTEKAVDSAARALNRVPQPIAIIVFSALAMGLFLAFRSRALVYGDGYLVNDTSYNAVSAPLVGDELFKPLSTILFRIAAWIGKDLCRHNLSLPMAIASSLGGVVGLWGLVALAKTLAPKNRPAQFSYVVIGLSSACTVLFFGYVEHYAWAVALMLWQVVLMIRLVRGQTHPLLLIAVSLLTAAFHLVFFPFIVLSILLIVGRKTAADSGQLHLPFNLNARALCLLMIGSSLLMAIVSQAFNLMTIPIPVWPKPDNPYWILSAAHLLDIANLLMLVAPLGITLGVLALLVRSFRRQPLDPETWILICASLLAFLQFFWIDPILGAPRDWDLLGMFGFPLTLLGAHLAIRYLSNSPQLKLLPVPALIVMLLLLIPNLYEKSHSAVASARLDNFLWHDTHYQTSYDRAKRALMWGSVLHSRAEEEQFASKYFIRRTQGEPADRLAWLNLGQVYFKRGKYDSSAYFFRKAVELVPDDPYYLVNLAQTEQMLGHTKQVDDIMNIVEQLPLYDIHTEQLVGIVEATAGRYQLGLNHLRAAHRMKPEAYEPLVNLGVAFSNAGQPDSALQYLTIAMDYVPPSLRNDVLQSIAGLQLQLNDLPGLSRTIDQLRHEFPTEPAIKTFTDSLTRRQRR